MSIENEKMKANMIVGAMKMKRVTQAELARRLGVTQSTISKMLKREIGYPLTEEYVKKICDVLDMNYEEFTQKSSAVQLDKEEYEKSVTVWHMEKIGIEIAHYIVSGGVVYYSTSDTNRLFTTDGSTFLSLSEMREKEQADIESFKDSDINDIKEYFDEYYSLTYCGVTRNLTVADYNMIIDMFNAPFVNLRKVLFSLDNKKALDQASKKRS